MEKDQVKDKISEFAKGFEQYLVAVATDTVETEESKSYTTTIMGECSVAFIADVIDSILHDRPDVLKALMFKNTSRMAEMLGGLISEENEEKKVLN